MRRLYGLGCERRVACFAFTLLLLCGASTASAAQSRQDSVARAQNPAAINAIEIDAGYKFDYRAVGKNEGYYRVAYKGKLVRAAGTPFKFASGLDITEPTPAVGTGDRNKVELRYEHGTGELGGGLFEALGVEPLRLRGIERLHLRGTAFVGGDSDLESLQFAIGLESAPVRLPGIGRLGASNWLVIAVQANRTESIDADASDLNSGVATYRAFLGRAFGWAKSADVGQTANKLSAEILRQAPTIITAKELAIKVGAIPAAQRSPIQQLLLDAIPEAERNGDWKSTVQELAYGHADAVTDQPMFALYVENSGWYGFANGATEDKVRNLLLATVDYWPLPKRDDVALRLRYEKGHERADPSNEKNHLLVSLIFRR